MTRARSRLSRGNGVTSSLRHPVDIDWSAHMVVVLHAYRKRLGWLVVGIAGYLGMYYLLTHVQPESIRNWLIPNLYVPLQVVSLSAHVGVASFLLLHTRRGILLALALQTLLFLQLQNIIWNTQIVLAILVFFGTMELSANLIHYLIRRSQKTAPSAAVHSLG